ncbi:TIM barrel protein [Methanomethylovorans sp.]|uniref:TIM barrel protein n=1 Tax=Methanomethylovorans sp. TaxID=2758717 RepID=UPI00345EABDE
MSQRGLFFGTAGAPYSSAQGTTVEGIRRVKELALDCMEIEFVRGVKMGVNSAKKVQITAASQNVALSVHAPYYINLNSSEPEKIDSSMKRIYDSAYIGSICGARSIVFHPAYYQKDKPEDVFSKVLQKLQELTVRMADENIDVVLRPETTGKPTQFGSLDETLNMCSQLDKVLPCIDFAHLHARSNGKENSFEEFTAVLEKVENTLGKEALENMHMHISGIEYGPKGEKKHLELERSDLRYIELMQALKDFRAKGLVISESPDNEGDALLLKRTYQGL